MQANTRTVSGPPQGSRYNIGQGITTKRQVNRRKAQRKTANATSVFTHRLSALKFSPKPYVAVQKKIGEPCNEDMDKQRDLLLEAVANILPIKPTKNPLSDVVKITEYLAKVANEAGCSFCIDYDPDMSNEEFAVFFYEEFNEPSNWPAPQIRFLEVLLKQDVRWYTAAIEAFRYFSKELRIEPFYHSTSSHYYEFDFDYMREHAEYDDDEEGSKKETLALIDSYEDGPIAKWFDRIAYTPTVPLQMLIDRIKALPELDMKRPILELLELCKRPETIWQYGYIPHEVERREEDYGLGLSLEQQFCFLYDYDKVTIEVESQNNMIYGEAGCQQPTAFICLNQTDLKGLTYEELVSKVRAEVTQADYPDKLIRALMDLCYKISQYMESNGY